MDEEFARQVCDRKDAGGELPPGTETVEDPPMAPAGYTAVVARLDLIADRIMSVRTAVQAGYAKENKEPSFDPLPRPTTAIERERERRTLAELSQIADSFFMQP